MKTKLSGLMDGELAEHEAQAVFGAIRQDAELRDNWLKYQLVGDVLKGEQDLHVELTGRVMAALDDEPTVLAPRVPRQAIWQRHAMAMAATLAGVAVVGWLALGTTQAPQPETVAGRAADTAVASAGNVGAAAVVTPVAAASPKAAARDMEEYLIAHEAQSSLLQFRGGAEHIRTVAAMATAPGK